MERDEPSEQSCQEGDTLPPAEPPIVDPPGNPPGDRGGGNITVAARIRNNLIIQANPSVEETAATIGAVWIVRPTAVSGSFTYNTTTQRFLPIASETSGAGLSGEAAHTNVASLMPRSIEVTGMWLLMTGAFGVGESATFQLNVDGVTHGGVVVSFVQGDHKAGADGFISVSIDSLLCLECTAAAGAGRPSIVSVGIKYRETPGTVIA